MKDIIVTSREDLQEFIQASISKALNDGLNTSKSEVEEIMDIQEAAKFLKLKIHTIYGFTSQKQIPFIKRGKKLYFERSKLDAWLKEGSRESVSDIQKRLVGK